MSDDRRTWLSLLAKADRSHLAELWTTVEPAPAHEVLRAPETGTVMVRGRQGATGGAFNLGEVTVTRCSVRLGTGEVGHGYVQGRDKRHARTVAVLDAMLQSEAAPQIRREILSPLAERREQISTHEARKAAATRVEFFTMARGQD